MPAIKILRVFLPYFGGIIFGLLAGVSVLMVLYNFDSGAEKHNFLIHWLYHQPVSHGLAILLSFLIVGITVFGRILAAEDRKMYEEKIKLLEEVGATRTRFAAIFSHEIRKPITAAKWVAKMLLAKDFGPLTQEQGEVIQKLQESVEREESLIVDFLDFSKKEVGQLELSKKFEPPRKVAALIEESIKEFESRAEAKKISLSSVLKIETAMFLFIDLKRIIQVVENLLENAIDYTPSKGKITINIETKNQNFQFKISDTGIGIPEKTRSSIFEKFYRSPNAKRIKSFGTGLGLYLSKQFIEGHQGKIWFESEEGHGSTFYFVLPLKSKNEIEETFKKL